MRVFFSLKGFDLRIGRSRPGSIVPGMIMSGILGKFGDDGVDSLPSSSCCGCCCGWGVAGLVSGGSGQKYLIFLAPGKSSSSGSRSGFEEVVWRILGATIAICI